MFKKTCVVIVLGCFSVANAEIPFCSGDICFIRPDPNSGKEWIAAQQKCKENNSTLPIADNSDHRKSFVEALSHFSLSGMDVWLGANASDYGPDNWRWLDRSRYSGDDIQQRGEYYKSYAYVNKSSTKVLAYASAPNNSYSYLCQYNIVTPDVCTNGTGKTFFIRDTSCYVKYDEKMSWFSARNNCLAKGGDLASFNLSSFTQLSLLDGIIDSRGFWVGLRHSQWNWKNAVTSSSSDVTFTSWRIGQPNAPAPPCIATDSGDFPNWKDIECTESYHYICQVIPPVSIQETSSTSRGIPSSTTSFAFGRPESITTSTVSTSTTNLGSSMSENNCSTQSRPVLCKEYNKNDSCVAVGVGIGIPWAITIVAFVVTVIVQQRENRKLRRCNLQYKLNDSDVKGSTGRITDSQASFMQPVINNTEGNMHYQQLQIENQLEDQRQYEQLPQLQHKQL